MLPAVILCGGFGTRLRSVVADRPKVLAPVAGEPFLGHLLASLRRQGVAGVVLSTGYLAEQVEAYAADGSRWGLRVQYAREDQPLGTGGALRHAADVAGLAGAFLALNGDTWFGGDVAALAAALAARPGAQGAVALVRVPDASRYGTVAFEEATGQISAFREKREGAGPAWINAGVYALRADALGHLPPGQPCSLERDVFPGLAAAGRLIACPYPDAPFLDIGTPEDYRRAEALLGPAAPPPAINPSPNF